MQLRAFPVIRGSIALVRHRRGRQDLPVRKAERRAYLRALREGRAQHHLVRLRRALIYPRGNAAHLRARGIAKIDHNKIPPLLKKWRGIFFPRRFIIQPCGGAFNSVCLFFAKQKAGAFFCARRRLPASVHADGRKIFRIRVECSAVCVRIRILINIERAVIRRRIPRIILQGRSVRGVAAEIEREAREELRVFRRAEVLEKHKARITYVRFERVALVMAVIGDVEGRRLCVVADIGDTHRVADVFKHVTSTEMTAPS